MGVKKWGSCLIAVGIISAVTASAAPAVPAVSKPWALVFDLPASAATQYVAETPRLVAPDNIGGHWACDLPIHIYYAAAPGVDDRAIVRQLEYPVAYLRGLGYNASIVREVSYHAGYRTPTTRGDVLLVVALNGADAKYLQDQNWYAMTERNVVGRSIVAAKTTVDGGSGLSSEILLHEFGHILGLEHKPGSVMGIPNNTSVAFDAGETAAVDCR